MAKTESKKSRRILILVAIAVLAAGFFGFRYWKAKQTEVPKGIAWGNGRLEAKLVDVSAKEPLRVKEILVDEGDLVKPGQVVGRLDTVTMDSELAQARANVTASKEQLQVINAAIVKQKSEIELATIETERSRKLVEERAGSQRDYDVRRMSLQTAEAGLAEEKAKLQTAKEQVAVAEANVATIQTRIDDAILRSPVLGRVLYRLVEPGEVLGPGGKALTIVNMEDVYMEIFLPAEAAARVKVGAEGRIMGDYDPRVAPGFVSFVSPEAQFTPKQVETRSEREKLMFRVKIQIPKELVGNYMERIKTGVRGVGYVKVDDSAKWPSWLNNFFPRVPEPVAASSAGASAAAADTATAPSATPAPATPPAATTTGTGTK
jgi:HlyD family secretion protein